MSVTLKLSPQTERVLREKAARAGQTLEAYLEQLARRDAQTVNGSQARQLSQLPPDQWIAELRAWAAGHRTLSNVVDDSREGIYEGRGE